MRVIGLSHCLQKSDNDKLTEEHQITQNDLRVALRRIDTLQAALNADITAGSDIEEEDEECDETHSSISDVSSSRRNLYVAKVTQELARTTLHLDRTAFTPSANDLISFVRQQFS